MDYLTNDENGGADEDNDDEDNDYDEDNNENGDDGNHLTSQWAAEDMDYLTGLNQCRRYNQTTTSGQSIFHINIFLYLCFVF